MSRAVPVLLFATGLSLMAAIQTKTQAQTAPGIPEYFFSTWTVQRDCTEAHAAQKGGHTLPGSQFRVARAADGGYVLQTVDKPGRRPWSAGWRRVQLEYRPGTKITSIPADFECVPGAEESQPFLAQSGFSVSPEPYYAPEHWYGSVTIHGEQHHLLIFPRAVKGKDNAAVLLIDADAGDNLQLDTGGTIIVEN